MEIVVRITWARAVYLAQTAVGGGLLGAILWQVAMGEDGLDSVPASSLVFAILLLLGAIGVVKEGRVAKPGA